MLLHLLSAFLWSVYGFMIESDILFIECLIVTFIYVLTWVAMIRDFISPKVPLPFVMQDAKTHGRQALNADVAADDRTAS